MWYHIVLILYVYVAASVEMQEDTSDREEKTMRFYDIDH